MEKRIIFVLMILIFCLPGFSQNHKLKIIITNIKTTDGTIVMSIHDSEKSFNKRIPLKTCRLSPQMPAVSCELELEAGEYAFCVFHDTNNDNDLNSNKIGIPKEPFGFSNYEGKSAPGNFKKHKITVPEATAESEDSTVEIPLFSF